MPVIEVMNINKRYGDRLVLQDVSFTVDRGEIFGLIGPNGAGKTTLVESIAGLRQPDAGQVRVLGLDPRKDRAALRRRLGIQLQASQLPDKIKVWEALDLYSSFYPHQADWNELLAALGLAEKRDEIFEKLSGGQKQRLSIALAMVGNPEILILDELTTGLDPEARRNIWRQVLDVCARGVTILLVSHFMEEVERLSDRLAVIDSERLVALDTPAGILSLAATSTLARNQIIAHGLCIEQASLDDAFIYIPRNTPHTFRILSGAARWFGFGAPAGFDQWFFETGQPAQALTLPPPESPPDIAAIVASLQAYGTETLGSPPGRPNQVS